MRTFALAAAFVIFAFALDNAAAQRRAEAPSAAGAEATQAAVRLFQPGMLSAAFAEEPADTGWARPTEDRIVAEIGKQSWPGLTRIEVACRRSICAALFVYSGGREIETKLKEQLRKGLGFVGIRSASKALPDGTVSEVLFFR